MNKICKIYIIISMILVSVCNGIAMEQQQEKKEVGDVGLVFNLFCPPGKKVILDPVSIESFKLNSDYLYLSIDDFLDPVQRKKNEETYLIFKIQCFMLSSVCGEYRDVLSREILPEFEKFATEDAPCEVAGFYDEANVLKYCEYLKGRLKTLKVLLGD